MISFVFSAVFCTVTATVLAWNQEPHWYIFPVLVCGILIGRDAADWVRGRVSLFDPAGIIGLLGVHFFFLAPLLHATWDIWIPYIDPPAHWRDWLGGMALLNAAGLVLYRVARTRVARARAPQFTATLWQIDPARLAVMAAVGLMVSGAAQAWVYATQGGISGYVESFTQSIGRPGESALGGLGLVFMVSEAFPIVAMIAFAVWARWTGRGRGWITLVLVLTAYFVLKMLFGGLRGSRMNTIYGLVWAVAIIHLWLRPLSKKFIFAGLAFLLVFMYVYGFYKDLGSEVSLVSDPGAMGEYGAELHRTFTGMVLGDLARADIQAFILYRLWDHDEDQQYGWGRTYLGSLALLIPRQIWPNRPLTKVFEGTELLWGRGSYDEDDWVSTYVYGLAGETMLNFGPAAVPFAYLLFGLVVGRLQRFLGRLRPGDARLLLYPFLLILCMSALVLDSEILLFLSFKDGLVAAVVVLLGVRVARSTEVSLVRVPGDRTIARAV